MVDLGTGPKTPHPAPKAKPFTIPLGAVARDAGGKSWVYVGVKKSKAGAKSHVFVMAVHERKHLADWAPFGAVKLETLLKKFPYLQEHVLMQTEE